MLNQQKLLEALDVDGIKIDRARFPFWDQV